MVPALDDHPDPRQLSAFGLGRLQGDQASSVEQHVAQCDSCCEQLRQVADDPFVEQLREVDWRHVAETVTSYGTTPTTADGGIPKALLAHPRYHVERRLGQGGMGVVYLAEHRLMQRRVALKVIHPRFVDRPQTAARFLREAQAAARLNHEHVVRAYDAEQIGDQYCLVMEYIEGESLDKLIARRQPMSLHDACELTRQAAAGLQAAHEHNITHRDIKPHNMMIDAAGRIKILDFGLARFVLAEHEDQGAGLTSAHLLLGTPDYMAPEQARESRTADIRSDIYSLGCTFYHMLTGRPPYPRASVIEKLAAHLNDEPTPLGELRPDAPAEFVAVLKRMMARAPADRYQTPTAVAEALSSLSLPTAEIRPDAALVATATTITSKTTSPKPLSTRARQRLAIAAAVALLAAAIVGGAWNAYFAGDRGAVASSFADQFADDELAPSWSVMQPASGEIAIEEDVLVMIPSANASWYNDGRGMFVYQEISGDFVVTTEVTSTNAVNPAEPPTQPYNSAGILARDPAASGGSENWIMITLGQQAEFFGTKTEPTWQSVSSPVFQPSPFAAGKLRLARISSKFYLLKKLAGDANWTLLAEHAFPTTPEILQVGLASNAYQGADLRAEFEYLKSYRPDSSSDLYRD